MRHKFDSSSFQFYNDDDDYTDDGDYGEVVNNDTTLHAITNNIYNNLDMWE